MTDDILRLGGKKPAKNPVKETAAKKKPAAKKSATKKEIKRSK